MQEAHFLARPQGAELMSGPEAVLATVDQPPLYLEWSRIIQKETHFAGRRLAILPALFGP
jgi:hypothetical protein